MAEGARQLDSKLKWDHFKNPVREWIHIIHGIKLMVMIIECLFQDYFLNEWINFSMLVYDVPPHCVALFIAVLNS